jgi:hypothetical protein
MKHEFEIVTIKGIKNTKKIAYEEVDCAVGFPNGG